MDRDEIKQGIADAMASKADSEDFDEWVVCDGLRSYVAFTSKLQRCWTHLQGSRTMSDRIDYD